MTNMLSFVAALDVIYTSRAYTTMSVSVCPSVCDRNALAQLFIVNLGFKFRSQFTADCGRGACGPMRA